MKYLLVLAVLVVAIWVWRNNRQAESNENRPRGPKTTALPIAMVACLECGTHLLESEVVWGLGGSYCCTEHRQQHERRSA